MAKKNNKRESPLKNLISETMQELHNKEGGFPDDPTFNAEEMSGPERFVKTQKHKDEVVIDSLLSNIAGKQGYFLKLKREMRPNEWMLMQTIENEWRQWPDIETEVARLVKEYTKRSPQKWGTALYRIEIACKGGIRGENYQPIDVWVNADEEFVAPNGQPGVGVGPMVVDPNVAVASKLEELKSLVDVIGGIVPKPQDPSQVQMQLTQAFQQGMQMKSNEGNNTTQMMTTMMTGMMGLVTAILANNKSNEPKIVNPTDTMKELLETLKTFGVLGNNANQIKEKTVVDLAKELKELGIDLFKKDDPLESISKLKQIAGIAAQFMGMQGEGERPSILEKIIDVVGPSIPGIVKDIKETAEKAVTVQQIAGQNIEKAKQLGHVPQGLQGGTPIEEKTTYQKANEGSMETNTQVNEQIKNFFNQVFDAVKTNNRLFYPVIYTSLLQDVNGQKLLNDIEQGTGTAKHLIELLQQYGGDQFRDAEFVNRALIPYTNGFILWVRNMMQPTATAENMNGAQKEFETECPICHAVYSFATEQEFNNEQDKSCGANLKGEICQGVLKPVTKV